MNSDLYFDGKQFISSSRAAKISGYVNDYIGQLCRDGKLDCKMVGRSWYVSFESLIAHKNANGSASKNKSKKTIEIETPKLSVETFQITSPLLPTVDPHPPKTNEFVPSNNYLLGPVQNLKQDPDPKPPERRKYVPHVSALEILSFPVFEIKVHEVAPLQSNIAQIKERVVPLSYTQCRPTPQIVSPYVFNPSLHTANLTLANARRIPISKNVSSFPKAFAISISSVFAFVGFFFSLHINPSAQLAYSEAFKSLQTNVSSLSRHSNAEANVFSSAGGAINEGAVFVYRTVNGVLFDTRDRILVMAGLQNEKKIVASKYVEEYVRPADTGMVVVPIDQNTNKDATVAKIKNAFSDEVSVIPATDNTSGVITPVFKKTKGNDYLYVLVPIKN